MKVKERTKDLAEINKKLQDYIVERKRIEDALRDSERRLKEAEHIAHLGHWEFDIVSNKLIWSDEIYRIFDLKPQEFGASYEAFLDTVHPNDREFVDKAYKDSLKNKTKYDIVHRLLLKDGTVKYVQERCETEYDNGGNPLRSLGTVLDVTERKKVEIEQQGILSEMGERVKELTCMYGVAKSIRICQTLGEIFNEVVSLIPPGWRYPEITCCRIRFNEKEYTSKVFKETQWKQVRDIIVDDQRQGTLEVFYMEECPELYEGPFLKEESNLIDGIASTLSEAIEHKQTDERLQASKEGLEKAQQIANLGNWEWDVGADKITWSDELYRIYDIDPLTPLTYDKLIQSVHPDDRDYHNKIVADWMKERRGGRFGYRIIRSDGSVRYLSGVGEISCNEEGKPVRMFGVLQDITERKRAEEIVKETNKSYERLMDNADEAIFSVKAEGGEVFYVNPTAERIFGYSIKEWRSDPTLAFKIIHPDYKEKQKRIIEEVNTTKKKVKNAVLGWVAKDGRLIIMEYTILPILDKDGNVAYFESIGRDITERKQAEEALRKEKDKAQKYLDVAGVIFVVLNVDQTVSLINKKGCEVLGYTEKDIIGKNWFDNFLPGNFRNQTKSAFTKLIAGEIEEVEYYENPVITKEDRERIISWHNTILRNEAGEIVATLSSGEDITERKRAEDELTRYRQHLEKLVEERTERLTKVNQQLETEINKRKNAEEYLKLSHRLLEITNQHASINPLLKEFLTTIKKFTNCTAIGIRILDKDGNIPYQAHEGFSEKFFDSECHLSVKENHCFCSMIVLAEFDPQFSFYTNGGSFYTNNAKEFWTSIPDEFKHKDDLRNACKESGYESLTLIPIRVADNVIGLIQLVDYKKDRFPLELIETLEQVTLSLGSAIQKLKVQENFRLQSEITTNMSEGVFLIRAADGIIVYSNPKFVEMFGYRPDEMVGKHVSIVNAPTDKSPEDKAKEISESINKNGFWQGEVKNIRKDGTSFWCLASVSLFNHPEHGNVFVSVHQDISERRQMEETLRKERDYLNKLHNTIGEAIFTVQMPERIIEYVNNSVEKIFGLKPEEIIGHPTDMLYPNKEEYLEFGGKLKSAIKQKKEVVHTTALLKKKNGKSFPAEITTSFLRENNHIVRAISIVRDIAARKQAEEVLLKSEKEQKIYNRISKIFLTIPDDNMYAEVLRIVLDSVESKFGIFAYIDENGILVCPSMTREVWDQCQVAEKTIVYPPETWGGIWGHSLREKKILHSNGPFKVPQGHLPITRVLCIPIIYQQDVIGLFEVANKATDYDKRDINLLENIVNYLAPLLFARLQRKKQEKERKQAEMAILKAKEEWEQTFDTVPDAIMVLDKDQRIVRINNAMLNLVGRSSDECIGQLCYDVVHGTDAPPSFCPHKKLLADGCAHTQEVRENNLGGDFIISIVPMFDEKKQLRGSVHVAHDITERKRAEEARLSRFRSLAHMNQINKIIQETSDIKQMMNKVLQKTLTVFQCDRAWVLFPADPDAPTFRIPMEHTTPRYPGALSAGKDVPMTPEAAEAMRVALEADGPIAYDPESGLVLNDVSKRFSVQSEMDMAIYPKIGKPWLFGLHQCSYPRVWTEEDQRLFEDIGHRLTDALSSLLFLKDLQESEEHFRTLVQEAGDVIIVLSPDFKILEFNREAETVYGAKRDKVLGKNYLDLFIPDEEAKRSITADCEKVLSGQPTKAFENSIQTADGSERFFSWNVNRLLSYEGYPVVAIASGHDITRRKQIEENLKAKKKEIEDLNINLENRVQEEVEKSRQKDFLMVHQSRLAAMGEMIGNIAHQWKQPLNALNILLYNIKDCFDSDIKEPELVDNFIEKGTELVMKMATTIDDFRYFFKPNKKKEKFCINKIINDSLALVHASLEHNNISVTSSLKGEMIVKGFPNEYSQVLLNILNNAKDAIIAKGGEGEIKIETYLESGSAVVKITDNGGGIPEEILNRVFDPYFTTKREEKGTGIGLYMSKMIIEEHMSGQIKAYNTTDGAEFSIITPIFIT